MKWARCIAAGLFLVGVVLVFANVREKVVLICEIEPGRKRVAYRIETSDGLYVISESDLSNQEEVLRSRLAVGYVVRLNYKSYDAPWLKRTIRGVNPVSEMHPELKCSS